MVQINWTIQANKDLESIATFISNDSKFYAKCQILRLKRRTHVLKSHIYSGQLIPEFNRADIRQLVEGNYIIVYRIVHKKQVDIITLHHSSRDLGIRRLLR